MSSIVAYPLGSSFAKSVRSFISMLPSSFMFLMEAATLAADEGASLTGASGERFEWESSRGLGGDGPDPMFQFGYGPPVSRCSSAQMLELRFPVSGVDVHPGRGRTWVWAKISKAASRRGVEGISLSGVAERS